MPNKIKLPTPRTVKLYYVRADKKDAFLTYCAQGGKDANGQDVLDDAGQPFTGVRDWLLNQDQAQEADFWTVEQDGQLLLLVALNSADTEWSGIRGFASYLQSPPADIPLEEHPHLRIP